MTVRLPLIFLLASRLFISGVVSTSILTIENKCKNKIWPVLYSYRSEVSPTGFALRSGEARAINASSSWDGVISARTLCSNSTGTFSCVTGDCESGEIECNSSYDWSPVTYVLFKIDEGGTNMYTISLEYGYNLPVMVTPSQSDNGTCMSSGCMVDLNQTCPNYLKKVSGVNINACSSACLESASEEDCCTGRSFNTKQTCKPSLYVQNFERSCPSAYSYAFGDNNSTFTCSNSTDFVITFCPSSIPNITRNNNKSSIGPLPESKDNCQRKSKPILGDSAAVAVFIILVLIIVGLIIVGIMVVVRKKNARKKNVSNDENNQMTQSDIPMKNKSIFGANPPMDGKVKPPNIQVFISFRGEELRNSFVGHLVDALRRSEINVFIDNLEQRGEDLSTLFKRIKDSGIALVVFSSRYTESKWCLDELVKIKECADKGGLKVLPIFYKVTPENVKRLKGEFGDNFRDKEHTYASDKPKITQWREAILFAANKHALHFDAKSGTLEADFTKTIVKEVLNILQSISPVESGQSSRPIPS